MVWNNEKKKSNKTIDLSIEPTARKLAQRKYVWNKATLSRCQTSLNNLCYNVGLTKEAAYVFNCKLNDILDKLHTHNEMSYEEARHFYPLMTPAEQRARKKKRLESKRQACEDPNDDELPF